MLSNCGAGKCSWESLGLQGDQTSQPSRKSTLNIYWKYWCWGWGSNTLATWWCEESTHWKKALMLEKIESRRQQLRRQQLKDNNWVPTEKGKIEDEMGTWHHWLNGHEFEQTPGNGKGQESLVCCTPWGHKGQTRLSDWTTTKNNNYAWMVGILPRSECLNFMTAVTIHSGFGAKKISHCFHCFPTYLPWSDRTGCHDLRLLNVEF